MVLSLLLLPVLAAHAADLPPLSLSSWRSALAQLAAEALPGRESSGQSSKQASAAAAPQPYSSGEQAELAYWAVSARSSWAQLVIAAVLTALAAQLGWAAPLMPWYVFRFVVSGQTFFYLITALSVRQCSSETSCSSSPYLWSSLWLGSSAFVFIGALLLTVSLLLSAYTARVLKRVSSGRMPVSSASCCKPTAPGAAGTAWAGWALLLLRAASMSEPQRGLEDSYVTLPTPPGLVALWCAVLASGLALVLITVVNCRVRGLPHTGSAWGNCCCPASHTSAAPRSAQQPVRSLELGSGNPLALRGPGPVEVKAWGSH